MYDLEELFADEEKSEFVIVAIPTGLAVAESERLLSSLENKITVKNVVVNQVVGDDNVDFFEKTSKSQNIVVDDLQKFCDEKQVQLKKVEYLNEEPRGAYGLKYLGDQLT